MPISDLDQQIRDEITLAAHTDRFLKFMLWLLTDPEHGAVRFYRHRTSYHVLCAVIDLYQRWLDGSKPPSEVWRTAAQNADAANVHVLADIAYAADVFAAYIDDVTAANMNAHANTDYSTSVYADAAAAYIAESALSRNIEVRQAQLYKLRELQQPDIIYPMVNKFEL